MQKDQKMYFVDIQNNKNQFIALDLEIGKEGSYTWIGFYDTIRGHKLYGEILSENEDGFVFHQINTDVPMTFRVATIKEYDEQWRQRVGAGVPPFQTKEELHNWYYENCRSEY